jgi:hypothetical protein
MNVLGTKPGCSSHTSLVQPQAHMPDLSAAVVVASGSAVPPAGHLGLGMNRAETVA